jgi:hypothetical protein
MSLRESSAGCLASGRGFKRSSTLGLAKALVSDFFGGGDTGLVAEYGNLSPTLPFADCGSVGVCEVAVAASIDDAFFEPTKPVNTCGSLV